MTKWNGDTCPQNFNDEMTHCGCFGLFFKPYVASPSLKTLLVIIYNQTESQD